MELGRGLSVGPAAHRAAEVALALAAGRGPVDDGAEPGHVFEREQRRALDPPRELGLDPAQDHRHRRRGGAHQDHGRRTRRHLGGHGLGGEVGRPERVLRAPPAGQAHRAAALVQAAKQSSEMTDIGPRTEEIKAADAQVQQMKAAVDYAKTQLEATEIKAPVAGTVLERIVERGEMVSPSAFGGSGARTSVVDLADLTDLQIELDISQADFARLKMGQRAEIIPEAFSNLRYSGFIEEIAPEANRAKSTVQIKVKVENPNEHLRPEMNARVNFLSDKPASNDGKSAARVLVPKQAVVKKDGGSFVFVVKANKVEQRTIRVGEETGDSYYVLDGLSGNESVAVAGVEKLRDGDRVKIQ